MFDQFFDDFGFISVFTRLVVWFDISAAPDGREMKISDLPLRPCFEYCVTLPPRPAEM